MPSPVKRKGGQGAALKSFLRGLSEGQVMLMFPEGTRTANGQLGPAQEGIGAAVIGSDAVVIPVSIQGSFEAWSRDMKLPRPHAIKVVFGAPLPMTDERATAWSTDGATDKAQKRAARAAIGPKVMDAIRALETVDNDQTFR